MTGALLDQIPLPIRFGWKLANGDTKEALHWPCKDSNKPQVVMMVITGNPGLIDMYIDFANTIHAIHGEKIEIIGTSHLGHSRFVGNDGFPDKSRRFYTLKEQVAASLAVFDELDEMYSNADGLRPKFILCGHSMGCYVAEKILESRIDRIDRVFSLFPAVTDIANTPRGRQLMPMFNPVVSEVASILVGILQWLLPMQILYMLVGKKSRSGNDRVARIVAEKMLYRSCVNNILKMAGDEMEAIKGLNAELYTKHGDKFVMYYSEDDHWVPIRQYELMARTNSKGKVILCPDRTPHAFVTAHSERMGERVAGWITHELE